MLRTTLSRRSLPRRQLTSLRYRTIGSSGPPNESNTPELPPEPTTCCMSGCQNCVWIEYAAEVTKILNDSGDQARDIVLNKISDPSLKMFLKMELQSWRPPSKEEPT